MLGGWAPFVFALFACALPPGADGAQLTLDWTDNADNEDGFRIERADGSGSFVEIAQVAANTTTYTDSGLMAAVSYSYRVCAYNPSGNSEYSNVAVGAAPAVLPSNLAPALTGLSDRTIEEGGSTGPLGFTVSDNETPLEDLQLTAASSNPELVPSGGIVFGGNGADRIVTVTPATGRTGTAVVTITVSDGSLSSSEAFVLAVQARPVPPAITGLSTGQTVFTGGRATLTVAASGTGLTYQWYEGLAGDTSNPLPGASASSYLTPALASTAYYWVQVRSGTLSVDSETVTVRVPGEDRYFFGTIGSNGEGSFAMILHPDSSARMFAHPPGADSLLDGILFSLTEAGGFVLAVPGFGTVEGQIQGSNLSGTGGAAGLALHGTEESADGPTRSLVGIFDAVMLNSADGRLVIVAGPAGRAWVRVAQGGGSRGSLATLDPTGSLEAAFPDGRSVLASIDAETGRLTGITGSETGEHPVLGWRSGSVSSTPLVNASVRARIQPGDRGMIAGFVIRGTGSKRVLLRGVGPTLGAFGVDSFAADPRLVLHRIGAGETDATLIAANDDWGLATNAVQIVTTSSAAGAFALPDGSRDAALLVDLPAGLYTAQVANAGEVEGTAIVEVYDVDGVVGQPATATLSNLSLRSATGRGSTAPIAGFIFGGVRPKRVLVRAVGPELADFGVEGALADPMLSLFRRVEGREMEIASTASWRDEDNAAGVAAGTVGAFALTPGSKSAALAIWLEPGAYTAVVESASGAPGVALIEVYEVE